MLIVDTPAPAPHLKQEHQIDVEVVLAECKGFVMLPRRWVAERARAWYEQCRRLIAS